MVLGRKKSKRKTKRIRDGIFSAGIVNVAFPSPINSCHCIASIASNSSAIDYAIFRNYDFPFTNLVFEGGGVKGLAYVGVLQVLENAGILDNVKRVCGSSIGSLAALLVYIGFTPDEIKDIMYKNNSHMLKDHKCGYFSLLPGLIKHFGWNPGRRLEKWLKRKVREKLGDGDCTFREAYKKTGKEFCVVGTNLNRMEAEYFHVKTTPDISIATAVALSRSIPGYFQPRKINKGGGVVDYFVDGGMFCNYPIHAFDGWWLSMKPEDSFFKRMLDIDNISTLYSTRFSEWNPETIGMLLYAEDEIEVMKNIFRSRQGADLPHASKHSKIYKYLGRIPNLLIYNHRKKKNSRHLEEEIEMEEEEILNSIKLLIKVINDIDLPSTDRIPLKLLVDGIKKSPDFKERELVILFGLNNIDGAVKEMDINNDGEISFMDWINFTKSKGIDLFSRILGYSRREIKTFTDFISAIESGLSICLLRSYVENKDADRTIGVNTGYIETTDFEIEDYDKIYLIECGRVAAIAYLREYCRRNLNRRRQSCRPLPERFFERLRTQSDVTNNFMNIIEEESQKMTDDQSYFPETTELSNTNELVGMSLNGTSSD